MTIFPRNLYAGVDRATDISLEQMRALHANFGARATTAYLDAPSEYHAWDPATVRELTANGYRILPVYVPLQGAIPASLANARARSDAVRASSELERFGWTRHGTPPTPVALDLEAHTFDLSPAETVEYAADWCLLIRLMGWAPVIYGTPRTILACDRYGIAAGYWAAAPVRPGYDGTLRPRQLMGKLQHMGRGGSLRGWQYAFEVSVDGAGGAVDINVWRGTLAQAPL